MQESTETTRRLREEGEERERKARAEIAEQEERDNLAILALKNPLASAQGMDEATVAERKRDALEQIEKVRASTGAYLKLRAELKNSDTVADEDATENEQPQYSKEDIPQFRSLIIEARNFVDEPSHQSSSPNDIKYYNSSLVDMGESAVNHAEDLYDIGEDKEGTAALTFAKTVLNLALELIPSTSFAKDLYEAWTGIRAFSSEKLSVEDHGIAILGAITFGLGGKIAKVGKWTYRLFNKGLDSRKAIFSAKKMADSAKKFGVSSIDDAKSYTNLIKQIGEHGSQDIIQFERLKAGLVIEEIKGSKVIGSAMKDDVAHRSASFMLDIAAKEGKVTSLKGNDGVVRNLFQVEGSLNENKGIYEWISGPEGLTHQRFIKNGKMTGFPNQIPKNLP